jgi:hypothetical protein
MPAKLRILFWLGVLTLFVPYLGITSGIRTGLTIAIGVLVIWITLRLRKQYKELKYRLRRLEEPQSTPDLSTESN